MDKIIKTPGFQHIVENILLNLDFQDILSCELINKSFKDILQNPMFWFNKWILRGVSEKNQVDWKKAIQTTRKLKPHGSLNLVKYLKMIVNNNHLVDIPCYINENTIMNPNWTPQTSMIESMYYLSSNELKLKAEQMIFDAVSLNGMSTIKVLLPFTNNPNGKRSKDGWTTIGIAASKGHTEIIKMLAHISNNLNDPNDHGLTPIVIAAYHGHTEVIKLLAPLIDNPNVPCFVMLVSGSYIEQRPSEIARRRGHIETATILETYQ